jgi:transcriptional repressor NrdR
MRCPFCGSTQVAVVNSRPNSTGIQIWRRRKCLKCENVFTTYEKLNLTYLIVIKKSGRRQRYERSKLYSSIYHSSIDKKNVDRGDESKLAEEITSKVEQTILKLKRKRIKSTEITKIVLGELRKKAPDSFLRFLAYREGRDKKTMRSILKEYF